jgi:hypothetical protein
MRIKTGLAVVSSKAGGGKHGRIKNTNGIKRGAHSNRGGDPEPGAISAHASSAAGKAAFLDGGDDSRETARTASRQ